MSVKDLMTAIVNNVQLDCFELEYDYECDNDCIDLRLYGSGEKGAYEIREIIEAFEFVGVTGVKVEKPTEDEVKYAFCGYDFWRVVIGVDRNVARGDKDHFFFNDAGRML